MKQLSNYDVNNFVYINDHIEMTSLTRILFFET